MSTVKTKNVFISHHHKDDADVDKLTDLLQKNGYNIRNSSIRAKPANQRRLDQGLVKDAGNQTSTQDEDILGRFNYSHCWQGDPYPPLGKLGNRTST